MNINKLNEIINRTNTEKIVKDFLSNFDKNKNNNIKRGIYIYGEQGCGKTQFVFNLLKILEYDIIKYNAYDLKSNGGIENLLKYNISDTSVASYFNKNKNKKKMVVVIDEMDGLNVSDKAGINSLIKLVREKKTLKQKTEGHTIIPIICIGNIDSDKKNKELMKCSILCKLEMPTDTQIKSLIKYICTENKLQINDNIEYKLIKFINNDLRKFNFIVKIILKSDSIMINNILNNILNVNNSDETVKQLTKNIFENNYMISNHNQIINDNDRTTVGLLWHENSIDIISKMPINNGIKLYYFILNNICFADYMDRITFQKQIWQFNEICSLIKTFYSNYLLHKNIKNNLTKLTDIRFTKVLTKYSTEYNNFTFIQNLCYELNMDKKDMIGYLTYLKNNKNINEVSEELEYYDISLLDINRIFRYIDILLYNIT